MMSNLDKLAQKFELDLVQKFGAKRGKKMSRRQINKELDKVKGKYRDYRNKLRELEASMEALEKGIQECKDGVHNSRTKMLHMNGVLQNMDLTDVNHVMFYDNDDNDVGYLLNGEEQHLDVNDAGDMNFTPMKDYRRSQRPEKPDENNISIPPTVQSDGEYGSFNPQPEPPANEDEDGIEFDEQLETPEPIEEDTSSVDDGFPNFRFID